MASFQERQHSSPFGGGVEATPEFGPHGAADRQLVLGKQLVDSPGQRSRPTKEIHPGRGINENHRRVWSRSSSNRTLPRSCL